VEQRVPHGTGERVGTDAGPLYVEVEGDGPAVVLVSGGPGVSHAHYHPWFSRLADRRTVVYYDHPGTGRSRADGGVDGGADPYTLDGYVAAVEAVRRYIGTATVDLVGLSFGGLAALRYAFDHPNLVRRLVLSNAAYDAVSWQHGNIDHVNHEVRTRYPELWERLTVLRQRGVTSSADEYQDLLARVVPALEWARPDDHPRLYRGDDHDGFVAAAYTAFFGDDPEWTVGGSLRGYDASGDCARLHVPTLVATGRHDRVTPPAVGHRLVSLLPPGVARLHVFESSGHRPWAEEPDAYFAELARFLDD
jgi:proline iminopeptidase